MTLLELAQKFDRLDPLKDLDERIPIAAEMTALLGARYDEFDGRYDRLIDSASASPAETALHEMGLARGLLAQGDDEVAIGLSTDPLPANLNHARSDDVLRSVVGDEDVDHAPVAEAVQAPSNEIRAGVGPLPPSIGGRGNAREDFGGSIDDGYNDQPLGEYLAYHDGLLRLGWRPTRWRHPVKGDLELVASDGFWIARTSDGQVFHHFRSDRFAAALRTGRTRFKRDTDGNLIAVAPVGPATDTGEGGSHGP